MGFPIIAQAENRFQGRQVLPDSVCVLNHKMRATSFLATWESLTNGGRGD